MDPTEKEAVQQPISDGQTAGINKRASVAGSTSKRPSFFIGDAEGQRIPVKIVGPDEEEIPVDEIVVPPDGGYGYVIVFAAFMSNVIVDGIVFSFGSLKESIVKAGEGTLDQATVAWVGSLLTGFYLLTGPFVSAVANKWGFRTVAVLGSLVSSCAFVISWYLNRDGPRIGLLVTFYGVFGGIGFSCIYVPAVIAVGFYFEKKRALATGIAICGSGIGGFIFPPFIQTLIQNLGWQKAILVLGATTLLCGVLGLLYKPLKPKKRRASQLSQDGSPAGTPLLQRIKKFRDMAKWDSVNSFVSNRESDADIQNANVNDTRARSERLYNQARKASTTSLKMLSSPISIPTGNEMQRKRMSVPSMLTGTGESPSLPQAPISLSVPTKGQSVKAKSFVGLPDLHEIEEEHGSEDAGSRENSVVPHSHLTAGSADNIPKQVEGTDDNENSKLIQNRNGSMSMSFRIGNSTLTVDEMSNSRIIRVASKVTLNKPMYRDDIFYTGSMLRIPEYANNVVTSTEWTVAMTSPPENENQEEEEEQPVSCCAACEIVKQCCGSCEVVRKMLDFSLLLSPTFMVFSVAGMFSMLGLFVPYVFLMDQARSVLDSRSDSEPVPQKTLTFLISLIGAANTIGRIVSGWIADRPSVSALVLNNGALTVMGLSTMAVPLLRTYAQFVGFSCVFGISMACFASLRSILVVELLGLAKLTNAFGLLLLFQGIASMIATPLAGMIAQQSGGDFAMAFYVAGGFLLFSTVMCFPLNKLNAWEKNRKKSDQPVE